VPGDLGIDLSPNSVAFARWRWGSSRRRFEVTPLEDRRLIIEEERVFRNTPRTAVQVFFACRHRG